MLRNVVTHTTRAAGATRAPLKSLRLAHIGLVALALLIVASPTPLTSAAGPQPQAPGDVPSGASIQAGESLGDARSQQPQGAQPDANNATCPSGGQCFADVPSSNPFYNFINLLYVQDIVSGYACGGAGEPCDPQHRPYYRPVAGVPRQQMAKFIANARSLPGIHIDTSASVGPIYARTTYVLGVGVYGESASGYGIEGSSSDGIGVAGTSTGNIGVAGSSTSNTGVYGSSSTGYGVYGVSTSSHGVFGASTSGIGVDGHSNNYIGVYGGSDSGTGVRGISTGSNGVEGSSDNSNGVYGHSADGTGVRGESAISYGMYGESNSGEGVAGFSNSSEGVYGHSSTGYGVWGSSPNSYGVYATSYSSFGVRGESATSHGVYGISDGAGSGVLGESTYGEGVYGTSTNSNGVYGGSTNSTGVVGVTGNANGNWAGYFFGNVNVTGTCCNASAGSYRIDDPTDPANKYLYHSAVESPDMMDIYNGNVALDSKGEAWVQMPAWFQALNRDFRYQLTPIGAPGPNLYVAQEIKENRFQIAGGSPGMKVSWQVTGIRQDPYAIAHPIPVEEEKAAEERGLYLHPTEYGQPASKGVNYEQEQKMQAEDKRKP